MSVTVGIAACASNAIKLDYHLEAFVRWHAPKVDELVINVDKASTDDTYSVLKHLQHDYPSLKVEESQWRDRGDPAWLGIAKLTAFRKLNTNIKLLIDVDEFIEGVDWLRSMAGLDPESLHPCSYIYFIGSYKTIGLSTAWPELQWRVTCCAPPHIREHILTDPRGSNLIGVRPSRRSVLTILHFGAVRKRELFLAKWDDRFRRDGLEATSFATLDWLTSPEGPIRPELIKEVPPFFQVPEFVRDDFEVYNKLCA